MKLGARAILGTALSAVVSSSAGAAFHLMQIVELFPGTQAAPNAQYIVLQMWASGQNQVQAHPVQVFNASGGLISTFTFPASVANSANQAKILIGTAEAATFFGVTANLVMTPVIPLAGGKVCFDTIDCVAWGNYTGSPTGVGTPFQQNSGGLRLGRAAKRRLDIAGSPTVLEGADDTNNSANDFVFGVPAPRNNAGTNGTIPPSTCGNFALEGLEACDDGDTDGGDGCRADCAGIEVCGDLLLDSAVGETCDDGNTVSGDACPANCIDAASAGPDEASGNDDLLASRGVGTSVGVAFTPACAATDYAAYWGLGAIVGGPNWTNSACALGVSGTASFDPGSQPIGELLYFVVVGYHDTKEGSYGQRSTGAERPEAIGVGVCDRPIATSSCP